MSNSSAKIVVHVFDDGRVLEIVEQVRADAALCADAPASSLSNAELTRALDALHDAEQLLRAAQAHVVREIDARRIPVAAHATSCSTWLRDRLRMDVYTAGSLVKQARALEERPALNEALIQGAVNAAQASVIDEAVRDLPEELEPAAVDKAESILIGWPATSSRVNSASTHSGSSTTSRPIWPMPPRRRTCGASRRSRTRNGP